MDRNTVKRQPGPINLAVRQPFTDPSTWYEAVYRSAENDINNVPWARRADHSLLTRWLSEQHQMFANRRALVVGCGLGDHAEMFARFGLQVTAFDIASRAIDWCRQRFPTSAVTYQVADLFQLPETWRSAFDLVFDAFTIQSLPPDLHARAIATIADSVAKAGTVLIMCHGRESDEPTDGPPWALAHTELDLFLDSDLQEVRFQDQERAGVRHFLVEYRKP